MNIFEKYFCFTEKIYLKFVFLVKTSFSVLICSIQCIFLNKGRAEIIVNPPPPPNFGHRADVHFLVMSNWRQQFQVAEIKK